MPQNLTSKNLPLRMQRPEAAEILQQNVSAYCDRCMVAQLLSQGAVSAWERGEYQPELTILQMKALCRALGVTLEELPDDMRPG